MSDNHQTNQVDTPTVIATDTIATEPVAIVPAITSKNVATVSSRDLPHKTLPVTPTDSASVTLMGATLSVPAGAVDRELTLSITALEEADIARLPQGMVNVTRDAAGFRLLPHDRHFTGSDVRIALPVAPLAIPRGYTDRDVFVYYYDEGRKLWTALAKDTSNHDNTLVRALTSHFTDMIAGVLQAPEMPETRGFAPTAMSGVKTADPLLGITSLQTPQAVQSGAATLSYPIATPAGRNGMQPSLALTYSSEGRGGWCGYGWSLPTPSIDIDTRWGVPRFDKDYETEIYLINGEQTTLQPHRSQESIERQSDREFFPRVENAFSKIVRHGDSPTSYWWEVTTKDGVVYTYKDVVRNDGGNIVHWDLSKVEEPHGDNVTYSYTEKNGHLYPTEIRYTNHGGESGAYSVRITLAEGDANMRRDVTTSCRLGLSQTDGELLGDISVFYKDELLARYVPTYATGQLRKTMLTAITQYDGDGGEVGTNRLDYYDDVKDGLFGEAETWAADVETFQSGVLSRNSDYVNDYSSIGGGFSNGASWGGVLSIGAGFASDAASVHAGYSATWNRSTSESAIALIDIDGDGLPDKVFADGGTLCYRPNLGARGTKGFGGIRKVHGLPDASLSRTKVEGFSRSVNGSVGIKMGKSKSNIGGGISYDDGTTRSRNVIYMQDFNGDGLVDLSRNGTVYFNHIGDDGEPYFTTNSYDTEAPLFGRPDPTLISDFEENADSVRAELEGNNPRRDVVRMWRAPYSGMVKVTGRVSLLADAATWDGFGGTPDGVQVSIQHEGDKPIWSDDVARPSMSASHNLSLNVTAGDRLFFRVRPVYSGALDSVTWDPAITYTRTADPTIPDEDENGLPTKTFKASDDFLHAGAPSVILVGPCAATLNMPVRKGKLRGDAVLSVVASSSRQDPSTIWQTTLYAAEVKTFEETRARYTKSLSVADGDTLSLDFHVKSDAPLDWCGLDWRPRVDITSGKDVTTMHAAPEIVEMYNKPVVVKAARTLPSVKEAAEKTAVDTVFETATPDKRWELLSSTVTDEYADDVTAEARLSIGHYSCDSASTALLIVLADAEGVFHSERARVDGKSYSGKPFRIPASKLGREINANFYAEAELSEVAEAYVRFTQDLYERHDDTYLEKTEKGDTICHSVKWTIHYEVFIDDIAAGVSSRFAHTELGVLYRGWGQFAWDGETDDISVNDLEYKAERYDGIDENALQNRYVINGLAMGNPLKALSYDAEHGRWRGENDNIHVTASGMSPSRMGEPEIVVETTEHPDGAGSLASVTPYTKSENHGISYNGSLSVGGLGVNGGRSRSTSETLTRVAVMDINGDRFPDWLYASGSEMTGRITGMTGRAGDELFSMPNGLNSAKGSAKSISAGASASTSADEVESGSTKAKASSRKGRSTGVSGTQECAVELASASECAAGISGDFSKSEDETGRGMMDINGDGLPDIVYADGTVRFGKGGSFTEAVAYGHEAIRKSLSRNKAAGGGVSIPIVGYASIGFGTNITSSDNEDGYIMQDVDGDGLPDKIDGARVAFNNGRGFDDYEDLGLTASASTSVASTTYGNTAAPVKIGPIFAFILYVTPSVTGSSSTSFCRTERQLIDIDGDGYVDMVEAGEAGGIIVRRNQIAHTNLLRGVTTPLGATITIEYARAGNTYDLPRSRWVMSRVTTEGGDRRNGATRFATAFDYKDGYYDRRERDFLGFGEVTATQLDTENGDATYRQTSRAYANRAYETRDLVTETRTTSADGSLISKTENDYTKKSVHDGKSLFIAPSLTKTTTYETGGDGTLTISESYAYDGRGNVTAYTSSTPSDSYTTEIKYHSLEDKNIFTRPSYVKVSADGKTIRHTTSRVNERGDLTRVSQIADSVTAVFDMERDEYGNVIRITRPQNASGQRFFRACTYDDTHHALVTGVTDAFGYHTSTDYDLKWRVPTKVTDINGNETRYAYDSRGRLTSVSAPYEIEAGGQATISVEYDDRSHTAKTVNYDAKTQTSVTTHLFTDDLGRAVQTKKSGVVDGKETMIVSGTVKYDAFGRRVAEGQPTTDNTASLNVGDILNPTLTEYDAQDRPVKVTLPDGTASTAAYSIADECLKTIQTDANGHVTDTYKDIRGRKRKTVRHADRQDVETDFHYNAIGELLSVVHHNKETTVYEYDGLGRKTSVNHPDAGLTTYEYDAAGNMTAKQTPNVRAAGGKIRYTYDYERLSETVYPKNIYNRVTYTYGDSTETRYNRAGRLKLVEDGSGGEAYYYGKLGEVTKTVKTVLLAETDIRTYIWEADYDSWNRVNSMTYPDGEVVTYGYDKGGNLLTVKTEKEGDAQTLIAEQRYDKYGNLTYRKMGDGTETRYDYDEKRLHLNQMSLTSNGVKMMENVYQYDAVDNILGISNAAQPNGEIGGTFSHSYQYDELNRLVSASGMAKDKNYELLMRYDVMSNTVQKDSVSYEYDTESHPNAVSRVDSKIFTYDANGNPISIEDTAANALRIMHWDEENRLQALGDDGYVSRYTYNHAGERVVKSHGKTTVAFVNGAPQGVLWHDKDNWTMYVSPYMVVNSERFTKHYYAGGQRIASKVGTGSFNNLYDAAKACVTAGQKDYAERQNQITQSRNDYYAALGIPPGPPTAKGIYGEAEYRGEYGDYMTAPLGNYDAPEGWPMKPYKRPYGGTPGPPVMYEKPSDPDDEGAGYGFESSGAKEKEVYFYHPDHLGSTSYITDKDGNVTQFVSYKPLGEALVDEHSTSFDTPWKFNGKELDAETGLYYYGARYYEASLAAWYGPDLLAEKYPSIGSYVYCHGNPIRLVDYNGNEEGEPEFSIGVNFNVGVQVGAEVALGPLHAGASASLLDIDLIGASVSQTIDDNGPIEYDVTSSFTSEGMRMHQGVSAEVGVDYVGNLTIVDCGQSFIGKYTDGYTNQEVHTEFFELNGLNKDLSPNYEVKQPSTNSEGSNFRIHFSVSVIVKIEFDVNFRL